MAVETRFDKVTAHPDTNPPVYVHRIEQLYWFGKMIEDTIPEDSEAQGTKDQGHRQSSVMFVLPWQQVQSALIIAGDGWHTHRVYFAQAGQRSEPAKLWLVFEDIHNESRTYGWKQTPDSTIDLGAIPTSQVAPFLKEAAYQTTAVRTYVFPRGFLNFDSLHVDANNHWDRQRQSLEVKFVPDRRDGEPEALLTLRPEYTPSLRWRSADLENKICTYDFTWPLVH